MPDTVALILVTYFSLLAAVVAIAFRWGGGPERAVARVMLILSLLYPLVTWFTTYRDIELGLVILDIAAFAALFWIASCANRWWPLGAAALQLDGVVSHFAMGIAPFMRPWAYALLVQGLTWLILFTLAGGAIAHRLRSRPIADWLGDVPRTRLSRWLMS